MDISRNPTPRRLDQRLTTPPGEAVADLSGAPLPTARTLRKRRSLPVQFVRFVLYNARIMRMVRKAD
ncbi:hypothetical protein [Nocardioides sp.]|uniref:hypothetical protein n=1 Tax=Nocardioides sp. TaxID=35761 RepID=UPI002733F835|nr:hypothetical protein [Nocardioides sp.]MDP3893810.1 hypothetical protein [Nocardioides sp.]